MIRFLLLSALAVFLLCGCDKMYGPAIYNDTDQAIEMVVKFSNGTIDVHLDPRRTFWQIRPGQKIESISVMENGRNREIESETLQRLLKQIPRPEEALFLLKKGAIDVLSINEAARQGYFKQ